MEIKYFTVRGESIWRLCWNARHISSSIYFLFQSEYHYEYTACDSLGSRWRVAVPHNPGLCTGLPDPIRGTECCEFSLLPLHLPSFAAGFQHFRESFLSQAELQGTRSLLVVGCKSGTALMLFYWKVTFSTSSEGRLLIIEKAWENKLLLLHQNTVCSPQSKPLLEVKL